MSSDDPWDEGTLGEQHRGGGDDEGGALKPEKRGKSSLLTALIIVAAVGGGIVLVCCGGFTYWGYSMQPTSNPQDVLSISKDIIELELPPDYEPKKAINMNLVVFRLRAVDYQSASGDRSLSLISSDISADAMQPGQDEQIRNMIRQHGFGSPILDVKKSEDRELEVRGKTVEFQFAEAEDTGNNPWRQVRGTFSGKAGMVTLTVKIEADVYDEQSVIKMIESIK